MLRAKRLDEVIVTGVRASLRESIETKKNATAFVDAITAEDVGKFPDKNLAESLQRVPGVVINREFGEGERVNLRGTAANLTRTLFNGHALATADWFILDQQAATRSFNYLMLPSDLIGKVSVYKSPQADLEEGGLGGLIDVASRNPLDMKANSIFASVQAAYTELADKTDPQASALYSWKNSDETLGVLVAGDLSEAPPPPRWRRGARATSTRIRARAHAAGAGADRLGAVPAGARAQRRQRLGAVPPERSARHEPERALLGVRRRQPQRELHRLGHARHRQRRHAHQRR